MSIGSNLMAKEDEQKYKELFRESIINEAAALIAIEGYSRETALQKANETTSARQEAIDRKEYSEDENQNTITFFDSSLRGTFVPDNKQAQVNAIAKTLKEEFDGAL